MPIEQTIQHRLFIFNNFTLFRGVNLCFEVYCINNARVDSKSPLVSSTVQQKEYSIERGAHFFFCCCLSGSNAIFRQLA